MLKIDKVSWIKARPFVSQSTQTAKCHDVFVPLIPCLVGSVVVAVCPVGCHVAKGDQTKDSATFVADNRQASLLAVVALISV